MAGIVAYGSVGGDLGVWGPIAVALLLALAALARPSALALALAAAAAGAAGFAVREAAPAPELPATSSLFEGVVDLLVTLRAKGWRIGIVTNGGVASQSAKIENSGLADLIDGSVISSAFGFKKPAPEIFRHMIEKLGIDPNRSWFVGDDPRADMFGARRVGFRTCWVERYSAWPADLPRCYDARIRDTVGCLQVLTHAA